MASNVVRRATFVLDFAAGETRINESTLEPVLQKLKEIKTEQEKITQAVEEQNKKLDENVTKAKETAEAAKVSFADIFAGAQSAAEGILYLSRAMALFGADSEGLVEVAAQVARIQGAIDLLQGGIKTVQGLTTVFQALALATNPVTAAIVGVTAVVAAGYAAWQAYADATSASTQALRDFQNAEKAYQSGQSQAGPQRDEQRKQNRLRNELIQGGVSSNVADAIIKQNQVEIAEERGWLLSQMEGVSEDEVQGAADRVGDLRTEAMQSRESVLGSLQSDVLQARGELDRANEADIRAGDLAGTHTSPREAAAEEKLDKAMEKLVKTTELLSGAAMTAKDVFEALGGRVESQENAAVGGQ